MPDWRVGVYSCFCEDVPAALMSSPPQAMDDFGVVFERPYSRSVKRAAGNSLTVTPTAVLEQSAGVASRELLQPIGSQLVGRMER